MVNLNRFSKIIIYGDGVVGKKTLSELRRTGLGEKIFAFTKTQANFVPYYIDGVKVLPLAELSEFYKKAIFLVAVSDKYQVDIVKNIKKLKIRNYTIAKKIYADSYNVSDLYLKYRKFRNFFYLLCQQRFRLNKISFPKIAHVTYALVDNAGDTVLSWFVRKFLFSKKFNLFKVSDPVDYNLIAEINKNDFLVVGGGGLFLPDTNENLISGWQWAISKELLNKIEKPIVLFSIGYNYFENQMPSELFINSLNDIVKKSVFVGLRNSGSIKSVQNLLAEELKSKVVYQPCITTLISKICNVKHKRNTRKICFNVAFDREEKRFGKDKDGILFQIANAAKSIEKLGYEIFYVAHCDEDYKFLPYLDNLKVKYKKYNFTQALPYELIKFYSTMQCVIGMRGHAQMIPFGCGCRIISLGSHDKMRWFLEDIDSLEWYVDLKRDMGTIANRIISVFKEQNIFNPDAVDLKIQIQKDKLYRISKENMEDIFQQMK